MKCKNVSEIITAWSESADYTLTKSELEEIKIHFTECSTCTELYSPLLSFFVRDSVKTDLNEEPIGNAQPSLFAQRTMNKIRSQRIQRTPQLRTIHPRLSKLGAAALILTMFFAGFLFRGIMPASKSETVSVNFTFNAPDARSVKLVGFFSGNLDSTDQEMKRDKQGHWVISLELQKGDIFTYNFVIDGTIWVPDPSAEEVVEDGFGGLNSLLRL